MISTTLPPRVVRLPRYDRCKSRKALVAPTTVPLHSPDSAEYLSNSLFDGDQTSSLSLSLSSSHKRDIKEKSGEEKDSNQTSASPL